MSQMLGSEALSFLQTAKRYSPLFPSKHQNDQKLHIYTFKYTI